MYYKENKNKKGEVVSVRIWANGKDPITNKNKNYAYTWKVPKGITKKSYDIELSKQKVFWYNIVKEASEKGIEPDPNYSNKCQYTFVEFAKLWLNTQKSDISKGHYTRCKEIINYFEKYFGNTPLTNMNRQVVSGFIDHLKTKDISKKSAVCKRNIDKLIIENFGTLVNFYTKAGICEKTLDNARNKKPILYLSAERIANTLKLPFSTCFEIVNDEEKRYQKSSIKKFTNVMNSVLKKAKNDGYIEENFASGEYHNVKIKKKERAISPASIYSLEEIKEFVNTLLNDDKLTLKKKIYFMCEICLGTRRGETLALRWSDINFDTGVVTIDSEILYDENFGVYEQQGTKSGRDCARYITAPALLINLLKEYKFDWQEKLSKISKDEFLFLNDYGKFYNPCSTGNWLKKFYEQHTELKYMNQHKFRHEYVSILLNAGIPVNVISQTVGHAQTSTTQDVYGHIIKNLNLEVASVLDNALS